MNLIDQCTDAGPVRFMQKQDKSKSLADLPGVLYDSGSEEGVAMMGTYTCTHEEHLNRLCENPN
jgi:hypothetical protein